MTAAEIGKIAGVSRSTVTAVINDYPYISDNTKKKVRKIIEEYGYVPNASARGLVGKKPKVIGLFLYNDEELNESSYSSSLIVNIIDTAQSLNYTVITCLLSKDDNIKKILDFFKNGSIQGAIVSGGTTCYDKYENLINSNYPIVMVDKFSDKTSIYGKTSIVNRNNFKGAYIATQYLIKKGHLNILYIGGVDYRLSSIERLRGYKEALIDNSINIDENKILQGDFSSKTSENLVDLYLENNSVPSAIFCVNDMSAIGAIHSLKNHSIKVPEDVSVIGFDDLFISNEISPKLTTIRLSSRNVAAESVNTLVKSIETNFFLPTSITIEPTIIERESVK